MKFLVETALLGHGLYSIKDSEIMAKWPKDTPLAWIEDGDIKIGGITEFIHARKNSHEWGRLDGFAVENNDFKGMNAFLTASGTMAVAKKTSCPIVVSAGIGGIGDIKSEQMSYDLPALSKMGITLIATSPKDMLDYPKTFHWLSANGVKTYGYQTKYCNGYLFKLEPYELDGQITEKFLQKLEPGCNLVLNPILEDKRFQDLSLLRQGIACGEKAEEAGEHYHPAVNAYFDRLSDGDSSRIQLASLIENMNLAKKIERSL